MIAFIDSFRFLSSSFDSLFKNFFENDFKHLSQEFDTEVLDLVKQKEFYFYEHIAVLKKFNETVPSKNEFYISVSGKGISDKEYQHLLKV